MVCKELIVILPPPPISLGSCPAAAPLITLGSHPSSAASFCSHQPKELGSGAAQGIESEPGTHRAVMEGSQAHTAAEQSLGGHSVVGRDGSQVFSVVVKRFANMQCSSGGGVHGVCSPGGMHPRPLRSWTALM